MFVFPRFVTAVIFSNKSLLVVFLIDNKEKVADNRLQIKTAVSFQEKGKIAAD